VRGIFLCVWERRYFQIIGLVGGICGKGTKLVEDGIEDRNSNDFTEKPQRGMDCP
jgi:hypothetical protein